MLSSLILSVAAVLALADASTRGYHHDPACTLTRPIPSGCGIRGHVNNTVAPYYPCGDPQIVDTIEECALMCSRHLVNDNQHQSNDYQGIDTDENSCYCQSVEYDTKARLCQLGKQSVASVVVLNPNSSQIYYDSNCFKCNYGFCNQPLGAQLLDNGDFEGELFGPWITEMSTLSKNGLNSTQAFECSMQAACYLRQFPNMCDDSMYRLDFDFLFPATKNRKTSYQFFVSVGSLFYSSSGNATTTGTWMSVREYTTIRGDHDGPAFTFLETKSNNPGKIIVDNIRYSRVPAPTAQTGAKSLLKNGGFESGELAPSWTQAKNKVDTTYFTIVSPGLGNSDFALELSIADLDASSSLLSQTLVTTPSTAYLVTFETLTTAQDEWTVSLALGSSSDQTVQTVQVVTGIEHQSFAIPMVANTNETFFQFSINAYLSAPRNITIDNFRLIEIETNDYY